MKKLNFIADKNDKIVNLLLNKGFSYNCVNKLLRNKDVKINDVRTKENIDVYAGSEIIVFYDENMITNKTQTFDIVFQDDNIAIINKPSGIEIEGENSLCSKLGLLAVHRLDRNTTGLVILAKNNLAQQQFIDAFKNHKIIKKYLAEVVGKTSFKNEKMKAYLVKDSKTSFVKIFKDKVKNSLEIETIFNTVKSSSTSSIVECQLITGRTHQIRASLAYLGNPIIGDGKYGKNEDNKKFKQNKQLLHCYYIKLNGLKENLAYLNNMEFKCNPEWFKNFNQ